MDIAKLQQQAAQYMDRGQYGEAIALYEQCINANPTLMSNYWYLGLAWLLVGEESETQAIWLSALTQGTPAEMDVWMADLLNVLEVEAFQHLHDHHLQLAEKIYWQILELDSERAEAHYNLGNALAQQGNLDEAVACWQRAIDLKPDFAQSYQNQGHVFQKLEEFDNAIVCYSKALEIQPNCIDTLYNLGLCLSLLGRLDDAIACFKKAIQIQPEFSQGYGDWGHALLQQGRLDDAIACFKRAIQIQPGFSQAYSKFIDTLINQGRYDEEIKSKAALLKALQEQQNSADLYFYLGNILRRNYLHLATLSYQRAIDIHPNSAELYLNLGKALVGEGNFDQAIASYQKALDIRPSSAELYLNLGKALAGKGNFDEAIASYQKALSINPDWDESYCYLGNALSAIGKWDEAIACYKKTLELQPDFVEACCNLGFAFAQRNQVEEAIACFRKVIEINSDLAKAAYDIITTLRQQGKLAEKTVSYQQILPVDPPNGFYESTWSWAAPYNLETSNYINIYPKNIIHLSPPRTSDRTIHFSFRFGNEIELPETFVAIVPYGRYWLNKSQAKSAIITSDNKLLADLSPEFPALSPGHPDKHPRKHSIFSLGKLPPVKRIDGTVAVLSGLLNDVYFHWMLDILPRIELLHRSGIEMAGIDKFLINSRLPFQKETLNILGVADTKILETDKYPHIKATKLVVPSFPGSIAWMPKWAGNFLRSVLLDQQALEASEKIDRLYISRSQSANRRIINEDEVINLLNKFGFKSVTLELMSVREQAALLANAKVVVAPHGSGLTNTIFCKQGTKVIEIFSPNYVYPCYWLISNLVGLDYYYLLGEAPVGFYLHKFLYPSRRIEDIFVNLDELLNILKFAEVI